MASTINLTAVTPTDVDRTDLLARLRVELHDEDSNNYRWVDATLERHLDRAARELSQVWPRERITNATMSGASRIVAIAFDDLVRIEAVEWPVDQYPAQFVQWSYFDGDLTLLVDRVLEDGEDFRVFWGGLHILDDDQSTIPTVAEDAVVTGASAYAALEWANFAINRANVAGVSAVEGYRSYGSAQLQRFQQLLAAFGERARIRVSGLFSPADGPAGRDVVRWEP
jgi:hypothetical protein